MLKYCREEMKININKILYYLTFGVFITSLVPHAFAAEVIRSEEIMQKGTIEENSPMNSFHNINGLGQDYYKRQINADKPEIHIKSIGEIREEKKLEKQNKAIQKEEKTADLQIFCNEMEYFEDRGELEARGDVQITSPSGVKITSDNALYNKADNTLKLTGDIEMVNGNTTVSGEYMFVDLNEENALMDDPITRIDNLVINAKEGFAYSDRIENLNGNVALDKQVEMELYSQGFTRFGRATL